MGTYDIFLTDLGLSTDYKSVALPNEIINKISYPRKHIINLMDRLSIDNINVYETFIKIDLNNLFDHGLSGHYSSNGYEILAAIIDQYLSEKYSN